MPKWTVYYNINSPENNQWTGTGYEFFDDFNDAEKALRRLQARGEVAGLRPFHELDARHLGAVHRA